MMNDISKYTEKEWEELASLLSEEQKEQTDLLGRFMTEDNNNIAKHWKELRYMSDKKEIDVDKAWYKVYSRFKESEVETVNEDGKSRFLRSYFLRVAAMTLVIIGLASALLYLNNNGAFSRKVSVVTDENQMNLQVKLPDGSDVSLNRNTRLSYKTNPGKSERRVKLSGEAFFEIIPDAAKPFIIDAGKATVKVLGTSFNVITENKNSEVEVFVKTGKVMLSETSGVQNLILDPGYIGTLDSKSSAKTLNNNPNYMSWNTRKLIYEGQKLDVVLLDLKKMYNVDIVTSDPEILNLPIKTSFENEPLETIIRIICTTFNLSYEKDGDIYHLQKK